MNKVTIETPRGKRYDVELIGKGTNWIKVQFDNLAVKTLLNFEAQIVTTKPTKGK